MTETRYAQTGSATGDREASLIAAVRERHLDIVSRCLAEGADPNLASEASITPLMAAAGAFEYYDDRRKPVHRRIPVVDEMIHRLLDAGADVDLACALWPTKGYTPLTFICSLYPYNVSTLIDAGADVNHADYFGMTPLMSAAYHRHPTLALLKAGADATAVTHQGRGVLHFVRTVETAKVLKRAGADIYRSDQTGTTPLLHCASTGNLPLLKWLAAFPGTLEATVNSGRTALQIAAANGHAAICTWLQENRQA